MGQSAGMAAIQTNNLNGKIALAEAAATNLSVAFGNNLTPVVGTFVDAGRGMLEWFTDIIEKYPAVSAVITAIAVAVGVVAVAVTAFALITSPIVVTAIHSITAAMMANPIFLIITGVVALTAAVVAFVAILASQKSEYDTWTRTTKDQYDELQRLNDEYERAAEQYGETSDEALALRYEVERLTEEFEASKKSVEQFVAEIENLSSGHDKLIESFNKGISDAKEYEQNNLALIKRLEVLATQSVITADAHAEIETILAKLNETIPNLAINYDTLMESVGGNIKVIEDLAKAEAERQREQATIDAYLAALGKEEEYANAVAEALANVNREQQILDNAPALSDAWFYNNTGQGWLGSWATDMDDYKTALETAQRLERENNELIEAGREIYERKAREIEEAARAVVTYDEAVNASLRSIQREMDDLIEKYDEAYESARSSIDSQIGLFDQMTMDALPSIKEMTAAMKSQVDYLELYTENLKKASEIGLDERLVASLADGSKESAGHLAAIIDKVEQLGETTQGAKDFVNDFNTQFSKVETAKDNFAATVADMETDFSTKMDEMEKKLTESIENMNMETEAAAAAKDTMTAYIEEIKGQQSAAVSAAKAVATATANALKTTGTVNITTTLPGRGYATGTASAEPGLALVGEEGPELINFGGGEVVYTAPETERIINNIVDRPTDTPIPANVTDDGEERRPAEYGGERRIILDITGHGEVSVEKGTDGETVWGFVAPRLKDAIIAMLKQEIFEEGELSYDY